MSAWVISGQVPTLIFLTQFSLSPRSRNPTNISRVARVRVHSIWRSYLVTVLPANLGNAMRCCAYWQGKQSRFTSMCLKGLQLVTSKLHCGFGVPSFLGMGFVVAWFYGYTKIASGFFELHIRRVPVEGRHGGGWPVQYSPGPSAYYGH